MCLPIYTHVSNIQSVMTFRRGGLILTWTVWPFSVRLLVVFHRIWGGEVGGWEGAPF